MQKSNVDEISNYSKYFHMFYTLISMLLGIGGVAIILRGDFKLFGLGPILISIAFYYISNKAFPIRTLKIDYVTRTVSGFKQKGRRVDKDFEISFNEISRIELEYTKLTKTRHSGNNFDPLSIGLYFYTKDRTSHGVHTFFMSNALRLNALARRLAKEINCGYSQSAPTSRVAMRYPLLFKFKTFIWIFIGYSFCRHVIFFKFLFPQPHGQPAGPLIGYLFVTMLPIEFFLILLNFFLKTRQTRLTFVTLYSYEKLVRAF